MSKVSIIIPYIREWKMEDLRFMILERTGIPKENYEIIAEEDTGGIGCPMMVKKLVEKAKYDIICFLGDDTAPQENFIANALAALDGFPDGVGLVGLNDLTGRDLPTHWVAHKKLLPYVGGDFFHTGYSHSFCDVELMERAKDAGKYIYAEDAVVFHHNARIDSNVKFDSTYSKVTDAYTKDKRLFYLRRNNNWETPSSGEQKLAIAMPVIDHKVHVNFMTSFMMAEKPSQYVLVLPNFPSGEFAMDISAVRNQLVENAIYKGATHILFCDTDQIYPQDTFAKMLSHKKPVVGAMVHRRYPPFDPILMRGELYKYLKVPDNECFSGELLSVDATGFGCILLDMKVFEDIPYPWFEVYIGDQSTPTVGEDILFCSKLRQNGVEIYVDTSAKVGHMSNMCINEEWYRLYKGLQGFEWSAV